MSCNGVILPHQVHARANLVFMIEADVKTVVAHAVVHGQLVIQPPLILHVMPEVSPLAPLLATTVSGVVDDCGDTVVGKFWPVPLGENCEGERKTEDVLSSLSTS